MSAEVVTFPATNLADIPAMLRKVADQIEAGDHGDVQSAFLVIPRTNDFPKLFGWGDIIGGNDPIIQLALCHHWLLANLVAR